MARTAPTTPAPNEVMRLSMLPPEVVVALDGPEVVAEEDPSVAVEGGAVRAMVVATTAPSLAVTLTTVSVAVAVATSAEPVLVLTARI